MATSDPQARGAEHVDPQLVPRIFVKQIRRASRALVLPLCMPALYILAKQIQTLGTGGYIVSFVVALTALLVVPGYVIVDRFHSLGWSRFWVLMPLVGFGFQLLVILVIYVFVSPWYTGGFSFVSLFIAVSFAMLVLAGLFRTQRATRIARRASLLTLTKSNLTIVALLVLALTLRLYLSSYSTTPATDGALYLAQARNSILSGSFSAQVSGDSPVIPGWTTYGLSTHPFVVFGLTLFFLMGDLSYVTGQIMALFSSLMLVAVSYYVAREAFGQLAGIVAGLLTALNPWLIFWSVVLYGPEILGTLWLLSFLLLLLIGKRSPPLPLWLSAGLGALAVLVLGSHYLIFWGLFLSLPLVLAFSGYFENKLKTITTTVIFQILSLPFVYFAGRPDFYILTSIPIWYWFATSGLLIGHLVGRRLNWMMPWRKSLLLLFAVMTVGFHFLLGRAYYFQQALTANSLSSVPPSGVFAPTQWYIRALLSHGDIYRIINVESAFWQLAVVSSGFVVVACALLSFLVRRGFSKKLIFMTIPVFGSLFYTVGSIDTETLVAWWNLRFVLSIIPLFIILASSICLIPKLLQDVSIRKQSIMSGSLALLVILLALSSYMPAYTQATQDVQVFNAKEFWAPVTTWASSTPHQSVFLVSDPYSWTWMTSRPSVALYPNASIQGNDLDSVINLARQYHANYLALTSGDERNLQLVKAYLSDSANPPYGFSLSFEHESGGVTVWIYDISTLISISGSPRMITLNVSEDTEVYAGTPHTPYGNLTVLSVGWGADLAEARVYLKFDESKVPANARILQLKLNVFVGYSYVAEPTSQPLVIDAKLTESLWNEANVTWLTQPTPFASALSNATLGADFRGYVGFTIRPSSYDKGSLSIVLQPVSTSAQFRYAAIFSKEALTGDPSIVLPTLEVTYLTG